MVGADVLGGPRLGMVPVDVPLDAARRGRRALPCVRIWRWDGRMWMLRGRGRRPRRPAFRMVPVDVPLDAARRGRRALPCVRPGRWDGRTWMLRGRGRRPRRPVRPWRSRGRLRVRGAPRTSRPTVCTNMALGWDVRGRCVVGADVLGGPRFGWSLLTSHRTRRAVDVAPYHGHRTTGIVSGGWWIGRFGEFDRTVRLCYNLTRFSEELRILPVRRRRMRSLTWLTAQRQLPPFEVRESLDSRMERGEPHRETWASRHVRREGAGNPERIRARTYYV